MIVVRTLYIRVNVDNFVDNIINKRLKELERLDLFKLIDIKFCETYTDCVDASILIIYQYNDKD
jgi:hypothetical protein